MSEPVNVTEPMSAPRTTKIVVSTGAPELSRMKSSIATRAAAPPPTALNSDTSCGIAVIFTVRARVQAGAAADQEADDDDDEGGRGQAALTAQTR